MPHLSWPRSSMSGRLPSPRVAALVGFNLSKSQCRRLGMRGEGAKGGWLVGGDDDDGWEVEVETEPSEKSELKGTRVCNSTGGIGHWTLVPYRVCVCLYLCRISDLPCSWTPATDRQTRFPRRGKKGHVLSKLLLHLTSGIHPPPRKTLTCLFASVCPLPEALVFSVSLVRLSRWP